MDHEIYLELVDLQNKYTYLYELLVEKGLIEKKEEKDDASKKKKNTPS